MSKSVVFVVLTELGGFMDLLKRQEDMENEALALGGERFRKRLQAVVEAESESQHGGGVKLIQSGLWKVEEAIAAELDKVRVGRPHIAKKWCQELGYDVAAYLVFKEVLDGISTPRPLHKVAREVAGRIIDELRYRKLREEAPALFEYRMAKFRSTKTTHYAHKKRSLDATMKWAGIVTAELDAEMTLSMRLTIGSFLVGIMRVTTGLFRIDRGWKRDGRKFKRELTVVARPETLEWLSERHGHLEFMTPVRLPMVVPPLPWGQGQRGGYRFARQLMYPLVRRSHSDGTVEVADEIEQLDMPAVYEALNAVQETAWRINADVLRLVRELQNRGVEVAKFPSWENEPLPAKPANFDELDPAHAARRDWRYRAGLVHNENHARKVRRIEITKMLSVVQQVEDVDEFYLPFNIDFRGRMYPLSDYLSPQGDDLSKALLQFARKKPLGPEGWKALAIHGANCMADDPFTGQKLDKLSLDDRIAWVKQNSSRIVETALDHWNTRGWWDAADKPFMFYAFCCEWSRYLAQGDTLMSGLPVSMDGSCNGIQHFSAMFRDEKAAKAVNVISNGWPEDLYSVVAEDVLRQVTRDAGNTDEVEADLAHRWLKSGLINRKLCKRPTMTFGYGSKRYGFTDQLRHYLAHDCDAEQRACFVNVEKNVMQQACRYMASRIWDSLKVTVQSAHQGMGWMQKLAQAAVKTGKPMRWYSPTRLLIVQEYYVPQVKKINTVLAGNLTVQPRYYVPTSEVVAHKQINGIAPNFIHSLDAAALCFTVVAAKEAGIESFGMVHDSFGTVAGDYHKLGEITREQFVRMYSECDVVGSLMQDVYHLTGPDEELPQPPKEGNLKLEEVLDSKYFFC